MTEATTRPRALSPRRKQQPTTSPRKSWLPKPIRRVFDSFPLQSRAADLLPQRAPRARNQNVLYIFQTNQDGSARSLSFNPSCLKWQAYLLFKQTSFVTRASNNHASPSGSLPFLLPAADRTGRPSSPVTANRIAKWVDSQTGDGEVDGYRQEYASLVEQSIRSAWLYHLYLDQTNFESIAKPMYIHRASSNGAVQRALAAQLQKAAEEELLRNATMIDPDELTRSAFEAFQALSVLLGQDKYFFGSSQPDLFDASVFAYTHLMLDGDMRWQNTTLTTGLGSYQNLVDHRNRIFASLQKADSA